tara:strand:+ start:794 stop:1048 length:255 start_codon:yes stop_codon:yes gene_type:complete
MKQPEYLILNPVFNKFPKHLITHRYINKPEPYTNIFGEIGWNNIKVFQSVKLYFKLKDINNYDEYMLERISEVDKGLSNYVKLN